MKNIVIVIEKDRKKIEKNHMQVAKNIMIGNAEVIEMIGESIVEEVIQGKEVVKEGDVNEFLHVYKFCILIIRR